MINKWQKLHVMCLRMELQFQKQQYNCMHNYNIANRYNTTTRVGNWYEEKELDNHEFKEYLYQKEANNNLTLNTTTKIGFSNQQLALTRKEGSDQLNFGDVVQLESNHTSAILAYNINQPILGEETYAVTTSLQKQPALRNAFTIESAGESSKNVCFGDKIRITTTVNGRKLYLQSLPVSPMRSSKFSRNQEVSVTADLNSNSLWVIEKVNAKERFDSVGKDVSINEAVLIKHLTTAQWLATETVKYVNDFGVEFQVFGKSFLTTNKTQNLFSEKEGHKSATNPLRSQGIQNEWKIIKG